MKFHIHHFATKEIVDIRRRGQILWTTFWARIEKQNYITAEFWVPNTPFYDGEQSNNVRGFLVHHGLSEKQWNKGK